jgi:predicted RNA-binding Zn ribbon-like protein
MVTGSAPATAASVERTQPDYHFDFCGGQLAIDFTNTVGSLGTEDGRVEHLASVGDVIAWAEAAGLLDRRRSRALRAGLAGDPERARALFGRAIDLREALYRVLGALARKRAPAAADLEWLNRYVRDLYEDAGLAPVKGGFTLETEKGEGLEAILRRIVRSAVELLTSSDRTRIGMCADDTCGWLFLDTTRNGARRWCDMKSCGNRSKVRRFRGTA